MKTASPPPGEPSEPTPQDITSGLAELERLANVTDPAPSPSTSLALVDGETKRVRQLRQEVAEAHLLAELQDDETPLLLDTAKVRKHRRRTWEAARLHQLTQDPGALAYRDAKVRRVTTTMTLAAAGIALAVSSIGVQASVVKALSLKSSDLGWWAAFGVEVVLSLPLLAAVGVQAYSAIRGRVVDRKSPEGRKLFRVELVLLGLTLTLNCWPAFKMDFDLLDLIVHSLGPVAAVIAVWVLPTLWKILSDLPVPWRGTPPGTPPVPPRYRENAPDRYTLSTAPVQVMADHIRDMIAAGEVTPNPGLHKIRAALGVGVEKAREVQKLLVAGGGS
ncbi:hypothetical protein ABT061_15950 [Streptosporangium sp. NPDC002544]|uniref:hypothetical protein n=1 Tax=Streptosporangium sp. NPDC002544 TaxID=3154538 RepID=UPI003318EB2D